MTKWRVDMVEGYATKVIEADRFEVGEGGQAEFWNDEHDTSDLVDSINRCFWKQVTRL